MFTLSLQSQMLHPPLHQGNDLCIQKDNWKKNSQNSLDSRQVRPRSPSLCKSAMAKRNQRKIFEQGSGKLRENAGERNV